MKCIKVYDRIERVSDAEAHMLVKTGAVTYCSKKEWREEMRDKKAVPVIAKPKPVEPSPVEEPLKKAHGLKSKVRKASKKAKK